MHTCAQHTYRVYIHISTHGGFSASKYLLNDLGSFLGARMCLSKRQHSLNTAPMDIIQTYTHTYRSVGTSTCTYAYTYHRHRHTHTKPLTHVATPLHLSFSWDEASGYFDHGLILLVWMPLPLGSVSCHADRRGSQLVGLCGITSLAPLNLPAEVAGPTPDPTIPLLGVCLGSLSCAHKEI